MLGHTLVWSGTWLHDVCPRGYLTLCTVVVWAEDIHLSSSRTHNNHLQSSCQHLSINRLRPQSSTSTSWIRQYAGYTCCNLFPLSFAAVSQNSFPSSAYHLSQIILGPINHSINAHRFNPLTHLVHFIHLFHSFHSRILQATDAELTP